MPHSVNLAAGRLLLVDDDPLILLLLERHLERVGYAIRTAGGGEEAWKLLEEEPDPCDVIVLDRMMPGLDGLGLLERIREDPRYRLMPVVLLTAASSATDMMEGFQAGASYYLTKPLDPAMLLAVVKVAVAEATGVTELREQLREEELGLRLLTDARFEYRTMLEAKRLAALVAHAHPDPDRVLVGLLELLGNAVEHGNLGITYAEKGALIEANALEREIDRRLELPEFRDRRVVLCLKRTLHDLEVHIQDEGAGFDFKRYLEFHPDRALDPHGRGIAMARRTAFDELEYLGRGNEVKARVRLG